MVPECLNSFWFVSAGLYSAEVDQLSAFRTRPDAVVLCSRFCSRDKRHWMAAFRRGSPLPRTRFSIRPQAEPAFPRRKSEESKG